MTPMSDLVLGPLVRYADTTRACVWVETDASAEVTVAAGEQSGLGPHLRGARTPLRAARDRRPGEGTHTPYTVEVDGQPAWPPADTSYPESVLATLETDKPLRLAFGSCRTSVGHDAARQPHPRRRRDARLRAADGRDHPCRRGRPGRQPGRDGVAGPRAVPRRPGLRRRDHRGDAGVHRVPPVHRRGAGQGAQGLRGVRPPLQAGLERPGEPLAALDAAEPDDLRRPRHPGRLEHVPGVEGGDGADLLVARPDRGRAGVVLGLPAPRQHGAGGARRGPGLAAGPRPRRAGRGRRQRRPRRVRGPRRPGARQLPVELCAGPRQPGPAGRRRLPGGAGAGPREALAARRGGVRLARRAAPRGRRPPADRHLAAVPARAGPALRRGVQRGAGRAGLGAGGWRRRARRSGRRSTSSTGRRSRTRFQRVARTVIEVAAGRRGRAPRTITFLSGDVHHSYASEAFRPRPRPSCGAGEPDPAGGLLADPQPASRASGASRPRSCRTAWPGRWATWSPGRRRCRTRRCGGG